MKERVAKTCTNIHANGGCNQCNRIGFSFLPVRYAVAKHPLAKQIVLSEERIKIFTDIFLNKMVDEQGATSNKNNDAWYILRKLRSGYLYVYDEYPLYPHWLCYAVGENGELTQFPAGQLALPEKVTCNNNLNYALSGLVALQDQKIDRTINIIFLEAPYNYERLTWISQNPEWRLKHMQQVTLSQIAVSPFYFSEEEIQKHVAEYSKFSPVELLKDDLEAGHFANINEFSAYANNERDTYASLLQAFNKAIGMPNKGCAVALFDTAGIIRQLNSYRMSAVTDFAKNLKHGDDGAEKEVRKSSFSILDNIKGFKKPHYELNERNYRWYLSVDKLKDLMASSLSVKSEDYGDLLPPGVPENYIPDEQGLKIIDFEYNDHPDPIKEDSSIISTVYDEGPDPIVDSPEVYKGKTYGEYLQYFNRVYSDATDDSAAKIHMRLIKKQYYDSWESKKLQAQNNIEKSEKEIINDYIEWDDWSEIKKIFDKKYDEIKKVSMSFDSDYVLWINKKLHNDLDRYDEKCPIQCGAVVKIIADILKDGILSGASKSLWQHILLDDGNFIDRGLSLNNTVLYDDIKETIANFSKKDNKKKFITPSGALNKELLGKIEKNAAKIRDFISKAADHDGKEIFKIKTAPLASTLNSLKVLHNSAVNTTSSLVIDELKNGIDKELIKQNTLAMGFRYSNRLVEIHNFGNTINKAFYGPGFKNYIAVEVQMTVSQANDYLNLMNKYLGKDTTDVRGKSVKLYDNSEKVGGNYQFDEKENGNKVTVFVFSREDKVTNIVNVINTRGVDALNSSVKTMYENQQKNIEKINMPSAAIIKLGCIYTLMSAINDYSDKKGFSSLWKLISNSIIVIQNSSEVASWALTKKAEKLLSKSVLADTKQISDEILERATVTIIDSEKLLIFSKAAGHIVSLMAVYDAIKGVLEAIDIYNSGGLSEDYRNKYISTGASFISSVVIGLFVSNIFLGAIVAAASIAILFFFDNNRIVPECIQNWLRRSKFGRQGNLAPGRSFADMDTEQGCLSMLFKGITFMALIENKESTYRPKTSEERAWYDFILEGLAATGQSDAGQMGNLSFEEYPSSKLASEMKKITIKISFPKKFSGSLELKALDEKLGKLFLDYVYLFDDAGNVARVSLINESENIYRERDKNIFNIVNTRIKREKDWVSIKDGQELWYTIQYDDILRIDEVALNTDDKRYPFFTEEFSFLLTEENTNNNVLFYIVFKSNSEIINQNYLMGLDLGSDRKN